MSRATPLSDSRGAYWIAYFGAIGLVWAMAILIAKRFFGANHLESVIPAFAQAVPVGVPLLLKTFGEAGAMPLFLLLAVHLPATATLLIEGNNRKEVFRTLSRLAYNPIPLAFFRLIRSTP